MRRERRPPQPLDPAALERLALRYVERYATTRARLSAYLERKLRERGWAGEGPADTAALAERMAQLGYVDDRGFAESRAAAMARRGLGVRRVRQALYFAGVDESDAAAVIPAAEAEATASALAFARRRRIGPYGREAADRDLRERQVAAMVRAGHSLALARTIARMAPGDDPETLLETD